MINIMKVASESAKRLQSIANHCSAASTTLTEKSFSKGTQLPPLTPGTLRLYSMRFCPYAQRTRLVLEYKQILYETVNVNLMRKPSWFLERNPLGLVPVLELNGQVIYESLATCLWLEDVYPQNRLQPEDPYRKARDVALMDCFGKVTEVFFSFKRQLSDEKREKNVQKMLKYYQFYENALAEREEGPFFGGSKPALVDLFIWPHWERIPGALAVAEPRCAVDKDDYPLLAQWFESMYTVPAVKATMFDDASHKHFLDSLAARQPDYDYGI